MFAFLLWQSISVSTSTSLKIQLSIFLYTFNWHVWQLCQWICIRLKSYCNFYNPYASWILQFLPLPPFPLALVHNAAVFLEQKCASSSWYSALKIFVAQYLKDIVIQYGPCLAELSAVIMYKKEKEERKERSKEKKDHGWCWRRSKVLFPHTLSHIKLHCFYWWMFLFLYIWRPGALVYKHNVTDVLIWLMSNRTYCE